VTDGGESPVLFIDGMGYIPCVDRLGSDQLAAGLQRIRWASAGVVCHNLLLPHLLRENNVLAGAGFAKKIRCRGGVQRIVQCNVFLQRIFAKFLSRKSVT
jgi:hypothetical protein